MADARDTDVLILGASFLGAELVYLLGRRAPQLRVTVVDRQRAHGYIPLVHERLVGRIDWPPFFQTWEISGRFPALLEDAVVGPAARALFRDAEQMLARLVE